MTILVTGGVGKNGSRTVDLGKTWESLEAADAIQCMLDLA